MKALLKFVLAILLALSAFPVHALLIESSLHGWIRETGFNYGTSDNNTYTGILYGVDYRGWAEFDFSGIDEIPIGANLTFTVFGRSPYQHQIQVYSLPSNPLGLGIFGGRSFFSSIPDGIHLGSFTTTVGTPQTIEINSGLSDIISSLGDSFTVGFANSTTEALSQSSTNPGEGVYLNGVGGSVPLQLNLAYASVPSPDTLQLMSLIFLIFYFQQKLRNSRIFSNEYQV